MEPAETKPKVRVNIGHLDEETGRTRKVKVRPAGEKAAAGGEEEEDVPRPRVQSLHMRMQLKVIEDTITRLRRECAALTEVKGLVTKVQQEIGKEGDFYNRIKDYAFETPLQQRSATEWFDILKEQFPNLATGTEKGEAAASSSSAEKGPAAAEASTSTNKPPDDLPGASKLSDNQFDDKFDLDNDEADVKYAPPKIFKDLHTEKDEEEYNREMLDLD